MTESVTMLRVAASAFALGLTATAADAAVTISIAQVGANVVATASGTFDRVGNSSYANQFGPSEAVHANRGLISFGDNHPVNLYATSGVPFTLGQGGFSPASSYSGTTISLFGIDNAFAIDTAYVSNSQIAATAMWNSTTFAQLGIDPGRTYTASIGQNVITLQVSALPAVPEPATWAMMIAGFAMVGAATRRRARSAAITI